jgi:hypothetical protein
MTSSSSADGLAQLAAVRAAGKLSLWLTVFTEDTSLESKLCNH